ncbi:hypothetical protein HY418_00105 [Candidatus Kaiserbacteria bacterium]|nr:hypothetical protein [Candidatus Kaiserbacteria bacterium]
MRLAKLGALMILAAPALAFAASPRNFLDLSNLIVTLLNSATGVLIVLGIAVYFYGISTNILKFGEGDVEKLKNYFFWGIIVLFVMVSLWGILRILQDTLFVNDRFNSSLQTPTGNSPADFSVPQYTE